MAISDYSTTPLSNSSISGIDISGATGKVKDGDNAIRQMMADIKAGVDSVASFSGLLYGLTLSNNVADATNDIDIATGVCIDSANAAFLTLASALTKRLDAAWVVGTNQGMLATGVAIADTTYHIFLIKRPDTGVVDIAADTSATGANIAANTNAAYTLKRRIGSIRRISSTIKPFRQWGDNFTWVTGVSDLSTAAGRALSMLALTVPLGIVVRPICTFRLIHGTVGDVQMNVSEDTSVAHPIVRTTIAGQVDQNTIDFVRSNTSGEMAVQVNVSSGTVGSAVVTTEGWIDARGRT